MYKLLIVEDEDKIRNGLANRIAWNDLGFNVCGLAVNGAEALALIDTKKPDVVLTDVRMPGMDGLELAEAINERYQDIDVLILSGFADFEYARQAIKLKIYDYLLKPTDKEILINTFRNLKLKRDQESSLDKKQRQRQFQIKAGLEKYKEYFLNNLLQGEYSLIYTIQDQLNSLELNLDGSVFCVCSLYIDMPEHMLEREWRNNKDLLKFAYANIIGELLDITGCGTVHAFGIRKVAVIFSFPDEREMQRQMRDIINESTACVNNLIFDGNAKIYAGIGQPYNNILNVHTSFLEAKKALKKRFFRTETKTFVYDDTIELENEKPLIKGYREDSNKIVSTALSGRTDELAPLLDALQTSLSSHTDVRDIKNYYYVLCFLLKSSLSEFELNSDIMPPLDFESFIFKANNIKELGDYVSNIFVAASDKIALTNDEDSTFKQKMIGEVKRYIEKNYQDNLTLKKIGQHVHLSPSYISFLFKEVTGETYTEYLKLIRIENAKTLLRRVDLKIYEIAEKVGYNDYKYFTLQFKKITDMSPTEYRDNL